MNRRWAISRAAFLDLASVHPEDLDLGSLEAAVPDWQWYDQVSDDELNTLLPDVDLIVTNKFVIDAGVLARARQLRLVCAAATGTNNIDVVAAHERGVTVSNVTAYATPAVVQHVFALLLALTTRLEEYTRDVTDGEWTRSRFFCLLDHPVRELAGKTLGIYGYGELGRAVARVASAFDMDVLIAKRDERDSREGRVALRDLLPQVDVLTLHCPLTESTRGLIGADEMALMKKDAVLINTARGGLVDEGALLASLQRGEIGGAGLDVLEQEPPPENHPLITSKPRNLIVTPHTAWASREARQRLIDEIALNIEAFKQGTRRNVVSADG